MFWMPLAMGALGAAKGISDQKTEARQRAAQAETTRYSPWTGMQAQAPQEANIGGDVMQGAVTGMGLGQGMDSADSANEFQKQQLLLQQQQAQNQGNLQNAQTGYYKSLTGQ